MIQHCIYCRFAHEHKRIEVCSKEVYLCTNPKGIEKIEEIVIEMENFNQQIKKMEE